MTLLTVAFWDNPLRDWLIAVSIAAGIFSAVVAVRWALARIERHRLANDPENELVRLLLGLARKTRLALLVVMALYVGSLALNLPETAESVLRVAAVIALLGQAGLWGNTVSTLWLERHQRRAGLERTTLGALGALRFFGRLALWSVLVIVALENMGVKTTTLVAGLGISGIAVALAAQSVLRDLFASMAIIVDKSFVVGDFIIVDDLMGTVESIGIKTTRIRSLGGEQVVVPNSDLMTSRIRNYKLMSERRIVFTFGVVYETPYDRLAAIPQMTREIIEAQADVRFDRAHFKAYGDFALAFEVVYYVLNPDYNRYMDLQQAINLALFRRFSESGIVFAYPTQTVYLNRQDA